MQVLAAAQCAFSISYFTLWHIHMRGLLGSVLGRLNCNKRFVLIKKSPLAYFPERLSARIEYEKVIGVEVSGYIGEKSQETRA